MTRLELLASLNVIEAHSHMIRALLLVNQETAAAHHYKLLNDVISNINDMAVVDGKFFLTK